MHKINFQPISKAATGNGELIVVHSIFFTIQGEGPNVGKPAVFVRLGGCNLQCPGCDTEYTKGSSPESVASILTRIGMAWGDYAGPRLVVITGGEPFRQNLKYLIHALLESYVRVQVETNGTMPISYDDRGRTEGMFQIVVSPKAGKVHESLYPYITAYKYVLDAYHIDSRDGLPTSVLGMPAAPARPHADFDGEVYVQPADEDRQSGAHINEAQNALNLKAAIDSAMKFGYRLCLQMHKIVGLE